MFPRSRRRRWRPAANSANLFLLLLLLVLSEGPTLAAAGYAHLRTSCRAWSGAGGPPSPSSSSIRCSSNGGGGGGENKGESEPETRDGRTTAAAAGERRVRGELDRAATPCTRRSALSRAGGLATPAASLALLGAGSSDEASAAASSTATARSYKSAGLRCLQDLPPVAPHSVRVYLCRHGETENNRTRRLMGSRIDQGLNARGRDMARRVGLALSYLDDDDLEMDIGGNRSGGGGGIVAASPGVAVHSALRRSIETAEIASATLDRSRQSRGQRGRRRRRQRMQGGDDGSDGRHDGRQQRMPPPMDLRLLPSLGGLDYGEAYTGRPAVDVRVGMLGTYLAWSRGDLDERMDGGGESGYDVLGRAATSLRALAEIGRSAIARANDSVGGEGGGAGTSILAVSHSSFLRITLAMSMDMPLADAAASLSQENGCINVLDINVSGAVRTLGPECDLLLGGTLSKTQRMRGDYSLCLPETKVVRINEIRHLEGFVS